MICKKCKTENASNSQYCRSCGAKLNKSNKNKILICAILTATLAIGIFFMAIKSPSDEFVDLGLSVKWGKCNVGATLETDFGKYIGFVSEYPIDDSQILSVDINKVGNPEKVMIDFIYEKCGNSGRLPSKSEWEELLTRCKWNWVCKGGSYGYEVIGPNGNSIFLPAAGYYLNDHLYDEQGLRSRNESGRYMSRDMQQGYYMDMKEVLCADLSFSSKHYGIGENSATVISDCYISVRLVSN